MRSRKRVEMSVKGREKKREMEDKAPDRLKKLTVGLPKYSSHCKTKGRQEESVIGIEGMRSKPSLVTWSRICNPLVYSRRRWDERKPTGSGRGMPPLNCLCLPCYHRNPSKRGGAYVSISEHVVKFQVTESSHWYRMSREPRRCTS